MQWFHRRRDHKFYASHAISLFVDPNVLPVDLLYIHNVSKLMFDVVSSAQLTIFCNYSIALQMSILMKPGSPLIIIFTSIFPKVTYLKTLLVDLVPGYGLNTGENTCNDDK